MQEPTLPEFSNANAYQLTKIQAPESIQTGRVSDDTLPEKTYNIREVKTRLNPSTEHFKNYAERPLQEPTLPEFSNANTYQLTKSQAPESIQTGRVPDDTLPEKTYDIREVKTRSNLSIEHFKSHSDRPLQEPTLPEFSAADAYQLMKTRASESI